MKYRKSIIIGVGVIVLTGTVYALYSILWFGSVRILNSDDFSYVVVDNELVAFPGDGDSTSVKLRPGTYTVAARDPVKLFETMQVSVSPFSTNEVVLTSSSEQTAADVISSLLNELPEQFSILESSFLTDNNWLVGFVGSDGSVEGFVTVYEFESGEWNQVEAGTGLDREYMKELGFPNEVINYIESSDS